MTDIKLRMLLLFYVTMKKIILPLFYIFEGISALIEIPKNCVVAAVGKELSEYDSFFLLFFILF